MAAYRLPTKGRTNYRGTRPFAIRSLSGGTNSRDIDGNACIHIELNDGTRYTLTRDCLKLEGYQGVTGKRFYDVVHGDAFITDMSQADYDTWLARIRAARAAK